MAKKIYNKLYLSIIGLKNTKEKETAKCISYSLAVFAVITIVAVAAVVIAAIFIVSDQNATQRYCIDIGDSEFIGALTTNINDRTVSWDFQHTPTIIGDVTSIHIMGPIPAGFTNGPLAISVCGVPSTFVCDTSVPGVLTGTAQGTDPLKTLIMEMRAEIWRYYIEFNDGITTIRAPLNSICGTP